MSAHVYPIQGHDVRVSGHHVYLHQAAENVTMCLNSFPIFEGAVTVRSLTDDSMFGYVFKGRFVFVLTIMTLTHY